jgi:hypothetical protein
MKRSPFHLLAVFLSLILPSLAVGQAPQGCESFTTDTAECSDGCHGTLPGAILYDDGPGNQGIITQTLSCSASAIGQPCNPGKQPGSCQTCQSSPGIPVAVQNDACDSDPGGGGGGCALKAGDSPLDCDPGNPEDPPPPDEIARP